MACCSYKKLSFIFHSLCYFTFTYLFLLLLFFFLLLLLFRSCMSLFPYFSLFRCALTCVTCVFVCIFHIRIRFASSGFWLPSLQARIRCRALPAYRASDLCLYSTWLYSSFLIRFIYNHLVSRGGGGRLVYNIHGILIADRSPEVRCSPLRFVMLSRQK